MPLTKYNDDFKQNLLDNFYQYINSTDLPLIEEFCSKNNLATSTLNSFKDKDIKWDDENAQLVYPSFNDAFKKSHDKQRLFLIQQGLHSKINVGLAIMMLKQRWHGWRDDYQLPANKGDSISIEVTGKPAEQLAGLMKKRLHTQRSSNIEKRKKMLKSG